VVPQLTDSQAREIHHILWGAGGEDGSNLHQQQYQFQCQQC